MISSSSIKRFIYGIGTITKSIPGYAMSRQCSCEHIPKSGGSYAHKQIAFEYAQYLDPDLGVLVNETFFQRSSPISRLSSLFIRFYITLSD